MFSCPRPPPRFICTACHHHPANSSHSVRPSREERACLLASNRTLLYDAGTEMTTHSRLRGPWSNLPQGEETSSLVLDPALPLTDSVASSVAGLRRIPGVGGGGGSGSEPCHGTLVTMETVGHQDGPG
ncbi:proviral integration site 1, isoform CRA_b [Rattus norvegicus]|uniref:Proviral integration site 1, isoform CRA_b n=1 Tax=Rattus norvegicus TaxID=10116 RepID=A6JJV1_RAT|nr:proviral integration site 1, isoform CRA_b [Rattus norvegicus]